MFELFIALFGGLFYALKIGGDRAGTKEYDRQTMERRAFHDARWGKWQAAVASVGLEDEVKQSIQCLQKKDRRIDTQIAKLGKVRSDARFPESIIEGIAPGLTEQSKAHWDETVHFWIGIRNELVSHGVQARLIFVTTAENDREATAYDVDDIEQFRYKHGTLRWLPNTYFGDDLKYISHKNF